MLFDELQLDTRLPDKSKSISRTVAGREKSTSEAVLKRLSAVHPLPALVLEYRQVGLDSDYGDGDYNNDKYNDNNETHSRHNFRGREFSFFGRGRKGDNTQIWW